MISETIWKVLAVTYKLVGRWPLKLDMKRKRLCKMKLFNPGMFLYGIVHAAVQLVSETYVLIRAFLSSDNSVDHLDIVVRSICCILLYLYFVMLGTSMWKRSELQQIFNGLMLLDEYCDGEFNILQHSVTFKFLKSKCCKFKVIFQLQI